VTSTTTYDAFARARQELQAEKAALARLREKQTDARRKRDELVEAMPRLRSQTAFRARIEAASIEAKLPAIASAMVKTTGRITDLENEVRRLIDALRAEIHPQLEANNPLAHEICARLTALRAKMTV
jgi:hypothetical protein